MVLTSSYHAGILSKYVVFISTLLHNGYRNMGGSMDYAVFTYLHQPQDIVFVLQ